MTDNLRALAEAATPGPWQDANGYVIADGRVLTLTPNNRAYIAAVDPQTVLALIDRAKRAEAVDALEGGRE